MSNVAIPPLPLALIEVHRALAEQRPLKPRCSFTIRASKVVTWVKWVSDSNDAQIPPKTDLGDPSTFWWMGQEEKRCEFTFYRYLHGECLVSPTMNAEDLLR